jgi:hypothetical protein
LAYRTFDAAKNGTMRNQIMARAALAAIICICLADCGHQSANRHPADSVAGASPTDTNPSVVTPPPADTAGVKSTPPIRDSNVVNPDSMGTSR